MLLKSRETKLQLPPQEIHTVSVRPTVKPTDSMTTEATLTELALFIKERSLDLRGITLNYAGQVHDYCRTKTSADAGVQKIEAVVQNGLTRLTVSFTGHASAEVLHDLQEATSRAVRRIELCETIIGASLPMRKLKETIELAAGCSSTVLITGESGTGKELVAQTIHNLSERASKPFICINCGALSEALLESELFGYVKGAFTGATANKKGLFEAAHKGTIFLDEFGEMSQGMQVKLLRVLQERK